MKSRKAFIDIKGKVKTKEMPAIESNDDKYLDRMKRQKDQLNEILNKLNEKDNKSGE